MSRKERKDHNPLPLRFGVVLAVSFAGFLFSRLRSKSTRPSLPPPSSSPLVANKQVVHCRAEISDDVHSSSTPRTPISEAQETETPTFIKDPPKTSHVERDDYEQEIERLNSMVIYLREREQSLETELLEYYGLKEQEASIRELQNRLNVNNVEAKVFKLKIEALQGENKRLESQVVDYAKVVAELEDAKAKLKELKKKLRSYAGERKEQILKLKKRVLMMQFKEQYQPNMDGSNGSVDPDLWDSLERLHELESEREELWKSKHELESENSELARRLESAQILATSMLSDPEVGELHNEVARLREENKSLTEEVKRLQSDRSADAETLVYLKWVNACLRYELSNYQPPPGKTVARDLSKTLNPTAEEKAKQLILEYANAEEKDDNVIEFEYDQWSSSQSHQTDSRDQDEATFDALASNKARPSKKPKFFDKLKRLVTGKDKDKYNKKASALLRSQSELCSYQGPRRNSNSTRSSEEATEMESMRMNRSSSASSSHSCKRFVLGGSVWPLDNQVEKSVAELDLARYTKTLKESSRPKKTHRKAASFSAS